MTIINDGTFFCKKYEPIVEFEELINILAEIFF
jgi:hypothetical protein